MGNYWATIHIRRNSGSRHESVYWGKVLIKEHTQIIHPITQGNIVSIRYTNNPNNSNKILKDINGQRMTENVDVLNYRLWEMKNEIYISLPSYNDMKTRPSIAFVYGLKNGDIHKRSIDKDIIKIDSHLLHLKYQFDTKTQKWSKNNIVKHTDISIKSEPSGDYSGKYLGKDRHYIYILSDENIDDLEITNCGDFLDERIV